MGVTGLTQELVRVGWLVVTKDGVTVPNFDRHNGQSGKRRAVTMKRVRNFRSVTDALPEKRREEKSNNYLKDSYGGSRFTPPTVEEVAAYCTARGNSVDPQAFVDYYTSNGWRVGRNAMKNWKAAVHTWEKNEYGGKRAPLGSRGRTVAKVSGAKP
jgi:hypothetical protein